MPKRGPRLPSPLRRAMHAGATPPAHVPHQRPAWCQARGPYARRTLPRHYTCCSVRPPFPLDRLSAVAAGRRRTRSTTMVAAATALTRSTTTLAAAAAYDYSTVAADALDDDGADGGAWRIQPPSLRVTPLPGTVPSLKRTVDAEAVTRAITTRLDCVALRSGCPVGAPVRGLWGAIECWQRESNKRQATRHR